jgi:2-oxoisovalerate dehydrogenase E1 component
MTRLTPIASEVPWLRLETTDEDWAREDPADLARWMEQLLVIRRFEERILALHGDGLVHGPAHASIGQEAGAVGAMSWLRAQDGINGTHRAHHQILAKLLNTTLPTGYDPRRDAMPGEAGVLVRRAMAEIMGLTDGFCGGRGGSMHMRWAPAGIIGSSAIIGANVPHAVGYALSDKVLSRDGISVAFFGDGTLMAGPVYEAINLAALYTLPVIFFLENNFYAVATHLREQTRETRLSSRGPMLGVPSIVCDGMDVIATRRAMGWAIARIRSEGGPVLIEAECYRFLHQSGPLAGSALGYRSREEEAMWRARDPLLTMPQQLARLGVLDADGLAALDARAQALVEAAAAALTETPTSANAPRLRAGLLPEPTTVDAGIRLAPPRVTEATIPAAARREVKFADIISETLMRAMERDPAIVLIGEDIHRLRGGVAGATRGIPERFPDRVFATPICENAFTGMALGAALTGLRPIVEFMFADFAIVAADQLFHQIGKFCHMFGGEVRIPLVVRARISPHTGYGSQHSGDPSGLFAGFPAWRIAAPATPFDYVGLMNTALLSDDPVLVLEHAGLFQESGPVPEGPTDWHVPFGRARCVRAGGACTVLTYGAMVQQAVAAAESSGVDAEILDLRSLDLQGMDWEMITASIRRTNRVLIAEQAARGSGHGARWAAEIQERLLDWLDAEVVRVSGSEAAPVVSRPLNLAALGDAQKVVDALRRLCPPRPT